MAAWWVVYELIARNRRMSWLLLAVSFSILVLVGAAVSLGVGAGLVGVIFGVLVAGVMTATAYWSSDTVALAATRAQPASLEEYPRLHNIVEGLCLAAGIPKPRVYVVHDPAPNAFATGRDPEHAAIAVTTGLMETMSRVELEGVIAHELSHVRNYDIRVMTIAVATAGAVAIICDLFWRLMWFGGGRRRDNNSGGNPIVLIGLVVVVVLAPLAAALIRAAVSRSRESLADASAVEITRYPTGLRQALEKLAANAAVVNHTSHATAHLWIESPLDREQGSGGARFNNLFNTHPPLSDRINALRELEGLPAWQGPAIEMASAGVAGVGYAAAVQAPVRQLPPAGWYPDPTGRPGLLRWWDGAAWSDRVRPG